MLTPSTMAIRSFWTSSGKSIGSIMSALLRDELHVVVTDCGDGTWEWETCRQGEPLPARMRDGPFKSEEALAAGKVALREFLELLEFPPEASAQHGTVSSADINGLVSGHSRDCSRHVFRLPARTVPPDRLSVDKF